MKKIIIVVVLLAAVFGLTACNTKANEPSEAVINDYQMTVTVSADYSEATIVESLTYYNDTDAELNDMVFYLYPNAYRKNAVYPAYFADLQKYGSLSVESVSVGDVPLNWSLSDSAMIMKVKLSSPLTAGSTVTVDTVSKLTIPESDLRLGNASGIVNITNFYPILSVYENGSWRTDEYSKVGNVFYSEAANYKVTIECSPETVVVCGADEVTESSNGVKKTVVATSENARDFVFSCGKSLKFISGKADNVEVNYYYSGDAAPESSLQTAISAVKTFSDMLGAYDGKVYNLVETPYYYGGMEYPRLSYINKNVADMEGVIIHETAHQWFACGVGSDSVNAGWQDEALVTFLTNYYYAYNGDAKKYTALRDEDKSIYNAFITVKQHATPDYSAVMDTSIYTFQTNYEYAMIEYVKGSLMFDAVYQLVGDNKLKAALSKYYADNLHKNATADDLYSSFDAVGPDVSGVCRAWLTDTIVLATFSAN